MRDLLTIRFIGGNFLGHLFDLNVYLPDWNYGYSYFRQQFRPHEDNHLYSDTYEPDQEACGRQQHPAPPTLNSGLLAMAKRFAAISLATMPGACLRPIAGEPSWFTYTLTCL